MAYKFQKGLAILSGTISPEADDLFDLGAAAAQYKDIYIDGIAYIDQLGTDADPGSAYLNGGEIDGTIIGGETKAAGTFTTATVDVLTATANLDIGTFALKALTFESDQATGTAPFTVASTTVVTNLNASSLGGATMAEPGAIGGTTKAAGTFTTATVDALTATANLDIGAFEMRASTFESDVATGTAPFTVASTTVVANLNASSLGGATMAEPGAIGGTTAAAVTATTLTATTFVMPTVTSGYLLVADGTDYEEVALSGDATLASGGAMTIANNAVSLAKMAGLTRGSVIIGDASGDPSALAKGAASTFLQSDGTDTAYVAMSGDATLSAGVISIGATKVTDAMINDDVATTLAGDGLSAASGIMALDLNELTAGVIAVATDSVAFIDSDGNGSKKESIADLVASMAGTGLTAVAGVLNSDAAGGTVTNLGDAAGTLIEGTNFSSANFTAARIWTLPASPTVGDVVVVKAPSNASLYALTVSRAGSQLIDGAATATLSSDYGSVSFVYMVSDVWGIK